MICPKCKDPIFFNPNLKPYQTYDHSAKCGLYWTEKDNEIIAYELWDLKHPITCLIHGAKASGSTYLQDLKVKFISLNYPFVFEDLLKIETYLKKFIHFQ